MSRGGEEGYESCRGFDARSLGAERKAPETGAVRMDRLWMQQEQQAVGQQAGEPAPQRQLSQDCAPAARGVRNARAANSMTKRRAGWRTIVGESISWAAEG
jgi:hypothetical protein